MLQKLKFRSANLHNKTSNSDTAAWQNHFLSVLTGQGILFEFKKDIHKLVAFPAHHLVINLIDLDNDFSPELLTELQNTLRQQGWQLIHLWEDVWLSKSVQVLFRLKSLLGKNVRIHGRKTKIRKITKPEADLFLEKNHLQGTVNARYKFGLFVSENLVAVATFSALRKMNHTENYKSIELIRFATEGGFTIIGGLSKVIKHIKMVLNPNDVMTYADRDWSGGSAYFKSGFIQTGISGSKRFVLDNNLNRKPMSLVLKESGQHVFNTGSLKFILKF